MPRNSGRGRGAAGGTEMGDHFIDVDALLAKNRLELLARALDFPEAWQGYGTSFPLLCRQIWGP
ncbi:MAG: hypothetical protein ACREIA_25565 [Opitutaceae bacterium]